MTNRRILLLTVAGVPFAVEARFVQGITRAGDIQIRGDGKGRFGWLVTRGGRRPVYDAAHFLHLPPTPAARPGPALVMESFLGVVLMVQRVERAMDVPESHLFDLPSAALGPAGHLITGVCLHDQQMIPVLRPDLHSSGPIPAAGLESRPSNAALATGPMAVVSATTPAAATAATTTAVAATAVPSTRAAFGVALATFSTDRPHRAASTVRFGVSLTAVREVMESVALVPIHLPNSYFGGFIPWRGEPVPVLDLNRRLGLSRQQPSEQNRFLVLRTDRPGERFAVACNSDIRIHHQLEGIAKADHQPMLNTYFVSGVYRHEDAFLVVPDLPKVAFGEESPIP